MLLLLDPELRETARFDLRTLSFDLSNIYDTANGLTTNTLSSFNPIFGDIAVFRPNADTTRRQILSSGISDGIPFVLYFQMASTTDTPASPRVVLMATGDTPFGFNVPRGIAVSHATGNALTTLPHPQANQHCPDVVLTFHIDDPGGTVAILPNTENGGIASWGMTIDMLDNFYLTAGDSNCAGNETARVILVPNTLSGLGNFLLFNEGLSFSRPADIAVSPISNDLYVTVPENDEVVRFPALTPLQQ